MAQSFAVGCEVELHNDSIAARQKRQDGPDEIGDVTLDELFRTGTHDIYEGLWQEQVKWEDMEYKRKLQGFRDRGIDPFDDDFATIDRIMNDDSEPDEPLPF